MPLPFGVSSRTLLRLSATAAAGYAVGSIQVPRIVQRLVSDEPVKDHLVLEWGDGKSIRINAAGSTTVEVTAGPALGAATALLDMSKAVVPVLVLRRMRPGERLDVLWATACVLGQMLPVHYRFVGGRGDAIVMGTCMVYDPLAIPVSIATSQFIGLYVLRSPLLGVLGWSAVLPFWFALRRRPELVAYTLVHNAVRLATSIPEMRQMRHHRLAGEFETREFHEAFERNHAGYMHRWLRERGLIHYDYMDEEGDAEGASAGATAAAQP